MLEMRARLGRNQIKFYEPILIRVFFGEFDATVKVQKVSARCAIFDAASGTAHKRTKGAQLCALCFLVARPFYETYVSVGGQEQTRFLSP